MEGVSLAMIGMSVMGSNFAKNFAEKGHHIAMFNRTDEVTRHVYDNSKNEPFIDKLHPVYGELDELVNLVGKQGIYFVMIKAGKPTDSALKDLIPKLEPGAIVIDCANSDYNDTQRRAQEIPEGIHFFGMGVSGGEEGARHGPSLMPGGTNKDIYEQRLKSLLESVSAKAPQDNKPCVTWCGLNGGGHFVKMVHNGIEYADIQLICEAYDLMHRVLGMGNDEIADIFSNWNRGRLDSYLVEITSEVLRQRSDDGLHLIDKILDVAQMKGTGTWTVMSSLHLESGVVPIPSIYGAVSTRAISTNKDMREKLQGILAINLNKNDLSVSDTVNKIEAALFAAKISSYAQGLNLIKVADEELGFGGIDLAKVAEIWRAGCIIRARFLADISQSYREHPNMTNLLEAPAFVRDIKGTIGNLSSVCALATNARLPFMVFDMSRAYILQASSPHLPLNLTQGLRDYFGAHTYKRWDREGTYHTNWSGDRSERRID